MRPVGRIVVDQTRGRLKRESVMSGRLQFSIRECIAVLGLLALAMALARIAPTVGQLLGGIVGGVLGYYSAKPFRTVLSAAVCGAIAGSAFSTATASVIAVHHSETRPDGVMLVVMGGVFGGAIFGASMAGMIAHILSEPRPSSAEGIILLRVFLYGHLFAAAGTAILTYPRGVHGDAQLGLIAQSAFLVLVLVLGSFISTPVALLYIGVRYRIPFLRWGPMLLADSLLAWFHLLSFLSGLC